MIEHIDNYRSFLHLQKMALFKVFFHSVPKDLRSSTGGKTNFSSVSITLFCGFLESFHHSFLTTGRYRVVVSSQVELKFHRCGDQLLVLGAPAQIILTKKNSIFAHICCPSCKNYRC